MPDAAPQDIPHDLPYSGEGDGVRWLSSSPTWRPSPDDIAAVLGQTPPDRGCRFKRQWFNKYKCRRCGYPSGWHHA
jgi:hypothetical protein